MLKKYVFKKISTIESSKLYRYVNKVDYVSFNSDLSFGQKIFFCLKPALEHLQ